MKHEGLLRVSPAGRTVRLLPLLFALMIPVSAPAETYWNFTYTVKPDNTLEITRYTGISDAVTIPAAIKGLPVTSIGKTTFYKCRSLKSVIIPESVTSIGEGAFDTCSSLARITVPSGVTNIGEGAFFQCGLTNIAIPEGMTRIQDDVFSGCIKLTSVTLPSSVTYLGKSSFSDCIRLTGITIPDNVTGIGSWAFSSCRSLVNVTIPGSVARIGDRTFYKCTGLTGVYFQGNAPAVGSDAFLYSSEATIYYLKGPKGWNTQFGGRPAKWWEPQAQINAAGISATNNSAVEAVEVHLTGEVWEPPQTNTPTGDSIRFSDTQSTDDDSYSIYVLPPNSSD